MGSLCDRTHSHHRITDGLYEWCKLYFCPLNIVPRIQVASKVPADGVALNMSLVREGTFDPQVMEHVLTYPVSLTTYILPSHPPDIFAGYHCQESFSHLGPTRGCEASRGSAHVRPAIRTMRRRPPRHRLVLDGAGRALLGGVPVDAPHLWRSALHSDDAFPPEYVYEASRAHAATCRARHRAELGLPGRLRDHLPEYAALALNR